MMITIHLALSSYRIALYGLFGILFYHPYFRGWVDQSVDMYKQALRLFEKDLMISEKSFVILVSNTNSTTLLEKCQSE